VERAAQSRRESAGAQNGEEGGEESAEIGNGEGRAA
jgi:hypothetical protein